MNQSDVRRNVLLYRIYVLFAEPLFWGPIVISSLQNLAHMPLHQIYYQESAVLIICVLLDIPSGALADLIGRKKTLIIGRTFLFGSALFFATMTNPLEAWIANILWAIGYTLQSGADSALLYDTIKESGKESEYKRIEGQAVGLRLILIAFCGLATGIIAKIDLRLPIQIGMPLTLIPLVVALFLKEPVSTKRYSIQAQTDILKQGIMFVRSSPEVRWMIGFAALLATVSKVWFFTYNPYFELVGLDIAYYGVIFFCLNMVAWLSSHYAHKIEKYLGERRCIAIMILCVGVPILIMGLLPIWPCAYLVLVQNIVRGFMRPFVGDYMNRHVTSDIRATVLSTQSSVANFIAIIALAIFGFSIANLNLLNSLIILGISCLILGGISYRSYVNKIA